MELTGAFAPTAAPAAATGSSLPLLIGLAVLFGLLMVGTALMMARVLRKAKTAPKKPDSGTQDAGSHFVMPRDRMVSRIAAEMQRSAKCEPAETTADELVRYNSAFYLLGRLTGDAVTGWYRRFDPGKTLAETLDLCQIWAKKAGVSFTFRVNDNFAADATGDAGAFCGVLCHAFRAAAGLAAPCQGDVFVQARSDISGGRTTVSAYIAIKGTGMTPAQAERAMDADERVFEKLGEDERTACADLLLARGFADLLKGSIQAQKTSDGLELVLLIPITNN